MKLLGRLARLWSAKENGLAFGKQMATLVNSANVSLVGSIALQLALGDHQAWPDADVDLVVEFSDNRSVVCSVETALKELGYRYHQIDFWDWDENDVKDYRRLRYWIRSMIMFTHETLPRVQLMTLRQGREVQGFVDSFDLRTLRFVVQKEALESGDMDEHLFNNKCLEMNVDVMKVQPPGEWSRYFRRVYKYLHRGFLLTGEQYTLMLMHLAASWQRYLDLFASFNDAGRLADAFQKLRGQYFEQLHNEEDTPLVKLVTDTDMDRPHGNLVLQSPLRPSTRFVIFTPFVQPDFLPRNNTPERCRVYPDGHESLLTDRAHDTVVMIRGLPGGERVVCFSVDAMDAVLDQSYLPIIHDTQSPLGQARLVDIPIPIPAPTVQGETSITVVHAQMLFAMRRARYILIGPRIMASFEGRMDNAEATILLHPVDVYEVRYVS